MKNILAISMAIMIAAIVMMPALGYSEEMAENPSYTVASAGNQSYSAGSAGSRAHFPGRAAGRSQVAHAEFRHQQIAGWHRGRGR